MREEHEANRCDLSARVQADEVSFGKMAWIISFIDQSSKEKIHALCAAYSALLDEVVPQRIQTVDSMKAMGRSWRRAAHIPMVMCRAYTVQESEVEMRKSRKRLMEKTKARLDYAREKQKVRGGCTLSLQQNY